MTRGPEPLDDDDADALTWGDEADTSHVEGPAVAGGPADADAPEGPAVMGSGALVAHGVLGGVALLSAVGWLVSADSFAYVFATPVMTVFWRLGVGLAVLAPVLWAVAAIVVVSVERVRRRLLVMAVGAVVVAPWPLVLGVVS